MQKVGKKEFAWGGRADARSAVASKGFALLPRPVGRAAQEAALKAEARRAEEAERAGREL